MFSSDYRSDSREYGVKTPMEAFWDRQRESLSKVRTQLLKRNGTKRAPRVPSRKSTGISLNGGRTSSGISHISDKHRRPSRPNGSVLRKKTSPSGSAQLPRLDTPPHHEKYQSNSRLRGTKYDIIPPVREYHPSRRRAPPPPPRPPKDYDSWGESESDSDDDYYDNPYPQPMPMYATQIPQPIFQQVPLFYPPRMRRRKRKKRRVRHPRQPVAPPQTQTVPLRSRSVQASPQRLVYYEKAHVDQATNTVENKHTQWDSDGDFMVDKGIDPINAAESRGGLRDNSNILLNGANFLDPRLAVMEDQAAPQMERMPPLTDTNVPPLDLSTPTKERSKSHRSSRLPSQRNRPTTEYTRPYRDSRRPHGTAPPLLQTDSRFRYDNVSPQERNNEYNQTDYQQLVVNGYNDDVMSLESVRNDYEDEDQRTLEPWRYDEQSLPIGGEQVLTAPERKYYYDYSSSRPNYISDTFDDSINPILKRYKYSNPEGTGSKRVAWADEVADYYEFPKALQALRHLLNHDEFAENFVDGFIEEFLEEEIPEFLLDWLTYLDCLPSDHPWFLPSLYYIEDLIFDEVILMSKDIVLELAQETVNDYLNAQLQKKLDPLEEFLDSIFGDVIYNLSIDVAKEGTRELADEYMENAMIYDVFMSIADDILQEEAPEIMDDAVLDVAVEEVIDEQYFSPEVDKQTEEVVREVLTHYDTKHRRKMIKQLSELASNKLLESLFLEEILTKVAHQGKIWTQSHYTDKLFNEILLDVLLGQFLEVPKQRSETSDNRALRRLHEKMVTDAALDVLLDELTQQLDEDLATLDENEQGENNPDPGLPDDVHQWLFGSKKPLTEDDLEDDPEQTTDEAPPNLQPSLTELDKDLQLL